MSDFGTWSWLRTYNSDGTIQGWGYSGNRERALSGIVPGLTMGNSLWFEATIFRQIGTLIDEIQRIETVLAPVAGKYPVNTGEPSSVSYPSNPADDVLTHWFGSQGNKLDPSDLYPSNIPYMNVFECLVNIFQRLDAAGI